MRADFQSCFEAIHEFLKNVLDKDLSELGNLESAKKYSFLNTEDRKERILSALDSLIIFLKQFRTDFENSEDRANNECDIHSEVDQVTEEESVDENQTLLAVAKEANQMQDRNELLSTTSSEDLVQIKASNSEIERRISAFIDQKQSEVDEINKQEFCSTSLMEQVVDSSCARIDSVFVKRMDGKSHIKVSRVVNYLGPQNIHRSGVLSPVKVKQEPGTETSQGIEERLHNVETHLRLPEKKGHKQDVFSRLKKLEERILYLESLSPEYFDDRFLPVPKRKKTEHSSGGFFSSHSDLSMSEIDNKMQQLKDELRLKAMNR